MFGMKNGVEVWKGALDGEQLKSICTSTLLKNQKEVFKANETINKLKEGVSCKLWKFRIKSFRKRNWKPFYIKGLFNKKRNRNLQLSNQLF